jgi:hypothetical protein
VSGLEHCGIVVCTFDPDFEGQAPAHSGFSRFDY